MRPGVGELALVPDGNLVFRFVQPGQFNASAPPGARVLTSALQTDEFTPNERSYGPSAFVKSLLANGLDDLHKACPKWMAWRVAEVPIDAILKLGVEVRLSPQDCEFESIRHAHASLIGVTKAKRSNLIRLLEAHLL